MRLRRLKISDLIIEFTKHYLEGFRDLWRKRVRRCEASAIYVNLKNTFKICQTGKK